MKKYNEQVKLLLQVLPIVATENDFALKGGTAINLFYREMPRLSVDIDLTYLPVEDRNISVKNISNRLSNIAEKIKKYNTNFQVNEKIEKLKPSNELFISKLVISNDRSKIKIEPNFTIRGSAYSAEKKTISETVQNIF